MTLGPNYRRLVTASGLSNVADGIFQLALPLLAVRLTRSPGLVAGVALAARLPWLVFALQAGALADRLDRKHTMVHVDLVRVVLIGGLALVTALGHEQLWVLYVVAFALGIGETMFDTAAQSVMPMVVAPDDLSRANGRLYSVEIVMNQFAGPMLGGFLAAASIALAFASSAAAYFVAAVVLLALAGNYVPARRGTVPTRLRTDIAEGLRYLVGHRLLRTMAIMVGVMNFASNAVFAVFPLYALRPGPMGLTERGLGLFFAVFAVGGVAGSLITPRLVKWWGRSTCLAVTVVAGAVMVAAPLLTEPVLVATASVVGGGFIMTWNVITVSLRQRIVPDHLLGRVNSAYRLLAWGTLPIGSLVGGVVAELFGLRAVFAGAGVASLSLLVCLPLISDSAIDAAEAEFRGEPSEEPVPS